MKQVFMGTTSALLLLAATAAGAQQAASDDGLDFLFESEPAPEVQTDSSPEIIPEADAAPAPDMGAESGSQFDDIETIPVESQEPATPQAKPKPATAQLEEIVVTAQKRQQSLQDVPLSVTAMDGDFIKDINAADLAEVSNYVPNVRVDADDLGSPQIFIRGFGTNAFNPSFESSVALVQDEIYYGRPGYFTESMFDVERVEVLRGPQGTLFGKNSIAGVFNVTTRSATDLLEGDARYTYGDNNAHRFEGGIGGPLGDWGAARVSALYRTTDGELYNDFLNRDEQSLTQKAARLKLSFYPTSTITTDLLVQASDTEAPFWPFQLYRLDDDTRNYLESFDENIEDDPYDFKTSFDTEGYIEKGSESVGLNTKWDIGDLGGLHDSALVLVLGGSKFNIDQLNELDVSPADISRLDSHEDHEQFTAELRFSAQADSLFGLGQAVDFVGGAFYYQSKYTLLARIIAGADLGSYAITPDALQLITGAGGAGGVLGTIGLPGLPILGDILAPIIGEDYFQFDYDQDVTSTALFGQMTWYLSDHWAITPGIRFNREEKKVDSYGSQHCRTAALGICIMPLLLGANDYEQPGLNREETDVSPKFVLQYFGDSGVNLYASYARGYKSGGFNSLSYTGEDLEFKPEKAVTYELGLKAELFSRTLRFNATIYQTEFDDLQVLAFNGLFFDVSNAASATSRGLEADFQWLTPWSPLTLTGSLGLLDASYDDYMDAPAPIRDADGNIQIGAEQDLSGERIAFAPEASGTFTPTLDFPLFGLAGRLAADVVYQGEQYTDTDLDPETRVGGNTKYSARFSLSNEARTWAVTLGCNNITDKRVLNQVTDASFFPGTYFAQQAAGRQLYAAVEVRY